MAPSQEITNGVRMLTIGEACEQMRVCRRTIHYWINKYRLPRYRIGGKTLLAFGDLQRLVQVVK